MSAPRLEPGQEALDAVLAAIRQGLAELSLALEAECDALNGGDVEAIDRAGARKHTVMQQLEELDAERRLLAQTLPPTSSAPASAWPEIVRALQQCQSLNQRNGGIVSRRLQLVRQALAVLTGHADDGLYDNTGGLHNGPGRSRPLAAA